MSARLSHIASAVSRLAVSGLAFTLAATPVAAAQQERLCRIVFKDTFTGRVDPQATEGHVNLGPKMPQAGGGFMMMGTGKATVTYGGPEGTVLANNCTVIQNRVFEYPLQAIVTSEDGANGEVDIIPGVHDYNIAFNCPGRFGGRTSYDVTVMVPPTVTLPMIRGASEPYEDDDGRARLAGTMSLEFCRVEPQ